ncbi:MAG TPA: wax ester/triacylglycerol synthase family O-acyltransferase [Mycobacteriales bacterium]|nr:wax ester/triacylglycerol synthase family O-acyltransferase [Mycobacteriales bacterium]
MTEQLSGMDAAFLALESPELPLHVVGVLLLDPSAGDGWSVDRFREVVRERLPRMPPFCRRLVHVPLALDRPYWHYETPDIDDHLFWRRLGGSGDLHALGDLVGEITTELLDRSKPLWQLYVVEGLADGRVALIAKVHHSTLYGAAGAEFIAELLDLSPEPASAPESPPGTSPATSAEPPGRLAVARRTALAQVRRPLAIGRLAVRGVRGAASAAGDLVGVVRHHGRAGLPPVAPSTIISGTPTARRAAAFAALSLDEARAVKDAAGVKLNDVVLAAVAVALRGYLQARAALPDRVVAGVPVNAGEGDAVGTNTLATMLVALPMQPALAGAELLVAVHDATTAAKAFTGAVGPGAIAELADVTPPAALSVVTWATRTLGLASVQPTLLNLVVSNVMGPPIPLYLAGAQVDAIYPLGPLLPGAGMNITVLSNLDRLDVGVMACPDLVDDVWELVDRLPGALAELAEAVRGG